MNNYEGIFIVRPVPDKTEQDKILEEIKGVITKNKGTIEKCESWGKRRLTYLINKQSEGTYHILEFLLPGDLVSKIEGIFKINDSILRVLIIKKNS